MEMDSTEVVVLNLITHAIEKEGCTLADVDFENLTIKVDGPDEVIGDCARAIAEIIE
jgi:hypothetical protein